MDIQQDAKMDQKSEAIMGEYQGIKFTVQGTPVAKGRPRFAKIGNFVRTYTPKVTVSYENLVKLSFMQACGTDFTPYDCALIVRIEAFFARTKGHFGTGRNEGVLKKSAPEHMTKKPDIDNCAKSIIDALNGAAFTDDKLIATLSVSKSYSSRPRCEVEVYPLIP